MMEKIIFDTDIGDDIDDAIALRLVLVCEEIEVLGVTTAYKNPVQRAKIAAAVIRECGKNIPVYAGAKGTEPYKALLEGEKLESDGSVRLLQYFDFMDGERIEEKSATDFILEEARKYPHEVTLLSLAPLCNVAAAYRKDPEGFCKLKRIVMMGGCFSYSFAEWNIRCDVESACAVFGSPVDIYAVGYDVTRNSILSKEQVDALFALKNASVLQQMLRMYMYNIKVSAPTMHDPLTASTLVKNFVTYEKRRLKVVAEGADRGKTVECEGGKEIYVAVKADMEGFMKYLFEIIGGTQK